MRHWLHKPHKTISRPHSLTAQYSVVVNAIYGHGLDIFRTNRQTNSRPYTNSKWWTWVLLCLWLKWSQTDDPVPCHDAMSCADLWHVDGPCSWQSILKTGLQSRPKVRWDGVSAGRTGWVRPGRAGPVICLTWPLTNVLWWSAPACCRLIIMMTMS